MISLSLITRPNSIHRTRPIYILKIYRHNTKVQHIAHVGVEKEREIEHPTITLLQHAHYPLSLQTRTR